MDWATLMQMMQAGGAGAGAGAVGGAGLAGAFAPDATMAGFGSSAPALGSGMFGVEQVPQGIMQMQPMGPMGTAPVAQGMGPVLAQGIPTDDASLDKLAKSPIDPNAIMKLIQQPGQSRNAPSAGSPPAGKGVGNMRSYEVTPMSTNRPGLAQLFGG